VKDGNGIYYYPFPENHRIRMYVREVGNDICFRLWNADDEKLWKEHGWVAHEAIRQAAAMYKGKNAFNPHQAYDIDIARMIIRENSDD